MATFETLAAKCAAGIALELLVAIANVESGMQPLAVRDGSVLTRVASAGEGVALVIGAADQGREARAGLMGLTERQLRAAGLTLAEGFEACASLTVAAGLIETARAATLDPNADATDSVAIRAWWRADSRFPSIAAFEAAIKRERASAALLAKRDIAPSSPKPLVQPTVSAAVDALSAATRPRDQRETTSPEPDCWDVFARQRTGLAQCEDEPRTETFNSDPRVRSQKPETASVVIFGSRATPH